MVASAVTIDTHYAFWTSFHFMQLLSNFFLLKFQFPASLQFFMSQIYWVSNLKLFSSWLDFTSYINYSSTSAFSTHLEFVGGYKTKLFLQSMEVALTYLALFIILTMTVHLVTRIAQSKFPNFKWELQAVNSAFSFESLGLRFLQAYYFVILVACYLNMQELQFENIWSMFGSYLSSVLFFLFLPHLPLVVYHLVISPKNKLKFFDA